MAALATEAALEHTFNEKTQRLTLAEIVGRSYRDGFTVNEALEEGWKQGVAHSMSAGPERFTEHGRGIHECSMVQRARTEA